MLKLGLGLYTSLLNSRNFDFAKQAGVCHPVVQLVDYMKGGSNPSLANNCLCLEAEETLRTTIKANCKLK